MLPTKSLPVVVIACRVLQDLFRSLLPENLSGQISYTDYGLHQHPGKLNEVVQATIDRVEVPSLVILGYGLCGDGLNGIKAGRHTLLIPRANDCIPLLLGSHEAYQRQVEAVPGTYYLSKGWLESEDHPLKEYEKYAEKYGPGQADWIMDMQYQHYERLLLVASSQADLDTYRPPAQQVARYCQRWHMRYEEFLGSETYIRRLLEVAVDLDQADEDFLVIPPGGEIRLAQFLR